MKTAFVGREKSQVKSKREKVGVIKLAARLLVLFITLPAPGTALGRFPAVVSRIAEQRRLGWGCNIWPGGRQWLEVGTLL